MNLHQYAETHEVTNQPPSLDGVNLYRIDLPLQAWGQRFGAGWAQSRIDEYGALAGGPLMAAGFLANETNPCLSAMTVLVIGSIWWNFTPRITN
jgi:putative acyl-CoA dehydrogenase